jgi:hypothetical protein
MGWEEGQLDRSLWTPRLSRAFVDYLQGLKKENRQSRIPAHMKTFTKWIHKLRPFPLGNPMEKIKALANALGRCPEQAPCAGSRTSILQNSGRDREHPFLGTKENYP